MLHELKNYIIYNRFDILLQTAENWELYFLIIITFISYTYKFYTCYFSA